VNSVGPSIAKFLNVSLAATIPLNLRTPHGLTIPAGSKSAERADRGTCCVCSGGLKFVARDQKLAIGIENVGERNSSGFVRLLRKIARELTRRLRPAIPATVLESAIKQLARLRRLLSL
jgi:hypothetical protein